MKKVNVKVAQWMMVRECMQHLFSFVSKANVSH